MKKVALAIAVASSLLLTGCASGFNAGTNTQGDSGSGQSVDVGSISVRNAIVVVDSKDLSKGTFVGTLVNTGAPDSLKSIKADASITPTLSEIKLPTKEAVGIGYNSKISISLATPYSTFEPGKFVDLTLVFANNQEIKLSMLVVTNTGIYSDVVVGAATPAPSAS